MGNLGILAKKADNLVHQNHGMMGDDGKDCFSLVMSLDLDVTQLCANQDGAALAHLPLESHTTGHGRPASWQWNVAGVGVT